MSYDSQEREWLLGDPFPRILTLPLQTVPAFSLSFWQNRKFVIFMALKWGSWPHESIWFSWIQMKPWTLIWKVNLGKFVYKDISCTKVWCKNSYIFQLLSSQIFSNKNISASFQFEKRNFNHERFYFVSFLYKTRHI